MASWFQSLALPFAKQFIAGETRAELAQAVRQANASHVEAIVDYLGEHVQSARQAEQTLEEYLRLLGELDAARAHYSISIKLTQFGLAFSPTLCHRLVSALLKECAKKGCFVWIDMEESAFTQETIDFYARWHKLFPRTGVCLQAYLKRSAEDAEYLARKKAIVRIVKGAYHESESIAFHGMADIDAQFLKITKMLLRSGNAVAIATHDAELVEQSWKLSRGNPIEFQFLRGIRTDLKKKMLERKATVAEYIPYGPQWFSFCKRRLLERKRNIITVVRSMAGI